MKNSKMLPFCVMKTNKKYRPIILNLHRIFCVCRMKNRNVIHVCVGMTLTIDTKTDALCASVSLSINVILTMIM